MSGADAAREAEELDKDKGKEGGGSITESTIEATHNGEAIKIDFENQLQSYLNFYQKHNIVLAAWLCQ